MAMIVAPGWQWQELLSHIMNPCQESLCLLSLRLCRARGRWKIKLKCNLVSQRNSPEVKWKIGRNAILFRKGNPLKVKVKEILQRWNVFTWKGWPWRPPSAISKAGEEWIRPWCGTPGRSPQTQDPGELLIKVTQIIMTNYLWVQAWSIFGTEVPKHRILVKWSWYRSHSSSSPEANCYVR